MKTRIAFVLFLVLILLLATPASALATPALPPAIQVIRCPLALLSIDPQTGKYVPADIIEPGDGGEIPENFLYPFEPNNRYRIDFTLPQRENLPKFTGTITATYSNRPKKGEVGTIQIIAAEAVHDNLQRIYYGELKYVASADLQLTHQSEYAVRLTDNELSFPLENLSQTPTQNNYLYQQNSINISATIIGNPDDAVDIYEADLDSYLFPTLNPPATPLS